MPVNLISGNDKLTKSGNLSDLQNVVTAKTNLSLQNVDNTSDVNKPVSTAQQTELDLKITEAQAKKLAIKYAIALG